MKLFFALVVFAVLAALTIAGPTKSPDFIHGELAVPKQFPYQVALNMRHEVSNDKQWCGGALISERWILTSASCTNGMTDFYLHFGVTNMDDNNEVGHRVIEVSKEDIIENNIALIKLPASIEFNENIQPAKLPKKSDVNRTYVGDEAVFSGWNLKPADYIEYETKLLRWMPAPIMTLADCKKFYWAFFSDTNICVRTEQLSNIWTFDIGSPLVLADGNMTLIGVHTVQSRIDSGPDVFTNVAAYLDWIEEHTGIKSV